MKAKMGNEFFRDDSSGFKCVVFCNMIFLFIEIIGCGKGHLAFSSSLVRVYEASLRVGL